MKPGGELITSFLLNVQAWSAAEHQGEEESKAHLPEIVPLETGGHNGTRKWHLR